MGEESSAEPCHIVACVGFSAVVADFVAGSHGFGGLSVVSCDFRAESLDGA